MLKHPHVSALMLGAVLAGPAVADSQSGVRHPAALADIDALTAKSDFAVFMAKDAPEELRRRALRRLWTLIDLPQSCMELCRPPEPAASETVRLAVQAVEQP